MSDILEQTGSGSSVPLVQIARPAGPEHVHEIANALVARYRNRHCPVAVQSLTDALHTLADVWKEERGE